MALLASAASLAPRAAALILAPATLDGPSSQIAEFGGAAVSADGSGGIVYTKQQEGVTHVFAAQYVGGHWLAPVRVDWDSPYEASDARIGAAEDGRLLVVWVTPIAIVGDRVQRALESSTLDPGASSFQAPIVVDPNVGEGAGAEPSLALAASGQGVVAYRVITDNFKNTHPRTTTIQPLRPGDVLADIRIARYDGQLWSSPERINRNSRASMRQPAPGNGPQVALGRGNQAVVAWQEPESSGVARIWARRLFGTTLGLVLPASPSTYDGRQLTGDADAFALSVSEFGEAKVVSRIAGAAGSALTGTRMFSDTLPVSTSPKGAQFAGPALLGAPGAGPLPGAGIPSVAVDDQGDFRIAFTAAGTAQLLSGGEFGPPAPEVALGSAVTQTGAGAVTALNPEGGGVSAWPGTSVDGAQGVSLREDFPGGGAQSALVSGARAGPVSQLAAAGSESGEALVGFREGEPGAYEIVGERVSAPPPSFSVEAPTGWVRPRDARISWSDAEDATGGVLYSVILDGHTVLRGLHSLDALPERRLLGNGVRHIQVLATDAGGQQTLSGEADLKVDGSPPVARLRYGRDGSVAVSVHDAQSGAVARCTRIAFGDGAHVRGRLHVRHRYARPGRYTISASMCDRVGNHGSVRLRASVR